MRLLCVCRCGGVAGVTPLPLPDGIGLFAGLAGRRHLLQQVQRRLGVYVSIRMYRIGGPAGPQGLLNPLLAAAGPADQLDTVQDGGRTELLP